MRGSQDSSRPAAGNELFRFDELVVCRGRRCVCHGQDRVHLRGRAFDALLLFLDNPGRTLAREKVMEAIWPGIAVFPNIVDHVVAEIRRALGDDPKGHRFIETIAREGYRWVAAVERLESVTLPCTARPLLAVLPFLTLGLDARDAWLGAGLASVLNARIAALTGIAVSPMRAVMRFAERLDSPLDAGRELDATLVLEGVIQGSGDLLRVTMRLMRVADGRSLWATTLDEALASVFSVEDAICEKVIPALVPVLAGPATRTA